MYLSERKKNFLKKIIKKAIADYTLLLPTVILNEKIDLSGYENKTSDVYKQIADLEKAKNFISKL